jgi:hypothetical protein
MIEAWFGILTRKSVRRGNFVSLQSSALNMAALRLTQEPHIRRARGGGARAVICNIDWLETFIASEHFHFVRLLHEQHGFDVVDSMKTDFANEQATSVLNEYRVLLTVWQGGRY